MQFLNTTNKYETSKSISSCNKNGPHPKAMEKESLWQRRQTCRDSACSAHLRPRQDGSADPRVRLRPTFPRVRAECAQFCTYFIKFKVLCIVEYLHPLTSAPKSRWKQKCTAISPFGLNHTRVLKSALEKSIKVLLPDSNCSNST